MPGKIKVFGYCRVSGQSQIGGDGLTRQTLSIQSYAKANGYEIVQTFRDEGVSGTLQDRPALGAMIVSLESNGHGVETVLIERVDRLARDLMVQEYLIKEFQSKGFNLVSVHEGADLLDGDPTRTMLRQILGAVAQYDKNMLVLKLKAARDRMRVKTGRCEGRKSTAESVPEALATLKKLRAKVGERRMTYAQMATALNKKGFKSASNLPFTPTIVRNLLHRYPEAA